MDSETSKKPSREDYMAGRATFQEFYEAVAKDAGFSPPGWLVERSRAALAKGDEHLNSIALGLWDALWPEPIPFYVGKAFRSRGDYPTKAGLVCMSKAAVRRAIRENPQ